LDKFYFIAHSWGGCVALHYLAKYKEKVEKLVLLDGGYHIKQFEYDYFSNIDKKALRFTPNCSLEEEIKYYENDFYNYILSNWEEFLEAEKNNYLSWSKLQEIAAKDLMKADKGKIKFRASGNTARGAIKSMYKFPTNVLYEKLKLLQAKLPHDWYDPYRVAIEVKNWIE
jgi:pimeloyl-ACP methyl ester carboxylesterase